MYVPYDNDCIENVIQVHKTIKTWNGSRDGVPKKHTNKDSNSDN